jgi:integrase
MKPLNEDLILTCLTRVNASSPHARKLIAFTYQKKRSRSLKPWTSPIISGWTGYVICCLLVVIQACAFSDYSILKPEQIRDGFIETKQVKTGDSVVIPIHPTVEKILKKYGGKLPPSLSNQKTNDHLKELGKLLPSLQKTTTKTFTKGGVKVTETYHKWELVSSHTARRSFATNEYLAGMQTVTIMAITGHRSEKSFLGYIKLTPNEHAKLLKSHWDKRNNLKAV